MTIARVYQCPGTDQHDSHPFRYLHHPSVEADPVPRFCPICGYDTEGEEPDQVLALPHIGKTIRSTVDTMYREMERGAEHRANVAMETHGMDASEAAGLRVTNLRDDAREGDTSDAPVNNEISRTIERAPEGIYGFQGAAGLGYSGAVSSGPAPNAGLRTMTALRGQHAANLAGAGHAGAVTSSLPALETASPGYRRRI